MQNRSHSPYMIVHHKICRMTFILHECKQSVLTDNENDSGRRIILIILVVGIQKFATWPPACKIYCCRLVQLGLWETFNNKACENVIPTSLVLEGFPQA